MKPSRTLLSLLGILLSLAIIQGVLHALSLDIAEQLLPPWWGALILLSLAALLDALGLYRLPSPQIERQLPGNLPLGRWSEVTLVAHHAYGKKLRIGVFDHVPQQMACEHLPQSVDLQPGQQTTFSYRLRPQHRGHFIISCCEVTLPSPLRLWQERRYLAVRDETRVYPDFTRLYGAHLQAVDDWISQLGVRQQQRRGLGQDFHQLREFRDGDSLRQIDWKATARKRSPIAREYQDERDQQIVFLIDCGQRMRSQDGELSHFDHALNATLLLSYVALRQGDAVGLMTFAGEQERYLAPAKGQIQIKALLNAVYDLHSTRRPADYLSAINRLLSYQRRRALVILVSNLRDEDDTELLGAVNRLGQRHRVLIASMREEVLDSLRQTPVENYQSALDYCGAVDYLNARNNLHERLQAITVPVLDARPGQLGPELVSQYLAWKKAGSL